MNSSSDAALGSMWAEAIDGMINVPGCEALSTTDGVLYMRPAADAPAIAWPRIFSKSTIFSLTASNPMGVEVPAAQNLAANARLEEDIKNLRQEPRAWWYSFGFNAAEGWRENGFSIAYAHDERVYGRVAVLKLARKYRQKAVYAYTFEEGHVVREVLFVGDRYGHIEEGSKERMAVMSAPPQTPLAAKDWQQP